MKKKTFPMFHGKEKQNYAAAVTAGDLVFCSGMTSRIPETGRTKIEGVGIQAWDAMDRIKQNLETAGTSLENIVRLDLHYVSDGDMTFFQGPSVMDYFRKNAPSLAEDMPAVNVIGLKSLRNPEQRAQIEVVAVTPEAKPKMKKYPLYYAGEKQNYAAAVVIGDLVFLSGISGRLLKTGRVELGDRAIQTRSALENIKQILEEAGTSLENIVSIDRWDLGRDGLTILDNVITDYARKNAPRLAEDMPCVTGVGAKSLCYPEELIVIEPIAIMPNARPNMKVYPSIWAGQKANYANS
ncbi:RidA family protein, partial [Chloroflexota bacterium]